MENKTKLRVVNYYSKLLKLQYKGVYSHHVFSNTDTKHRTVKHDNKSYIMTVFFCIYSLKLRKYVFSNFISFSKYSPLTEVI